MGVASERFFAWQWEGEFYAPATSVPLTDLGFRVGYSAFESLALEAGGAEFLAEHLARLRATCERLQIPFPAEALEPARIEETWRGQAGFARIVVTIGDFAAAPEPRVFLLVEARERAAMLRWRLDFQPGPHAPAFGGLKCGAYAQNIFALHAAHRRGVDDALLCNAQGELISASVTNVFLVRNGVLSTPALEQGARDGVVRSWVNAQRPVRAGIITRAEVEAADEIFLTNSWIGLRPATELNGRALSTELGAALAAEFAARASRRLQEPGA